MYKYSVVISPKSNRDIEEIYWYIFFTLQNPISADKIVKKIRNRCRSLSIFPNGYVVKVIRNNIKYRFLHVDNYTIVYYVDDASRTVFIDGVFYSRRNIAELI